MMHRLVTMALACTVTIAVSAQSGQSPLPRTPWGDPDLQGIWTTDDGRSVPLQRPPEFGTRRLLTDAEFAERKRRDDETRGDTRAGAGTFVGEVGMRTLRQTSLVVEPSDGRIPALTPDAQRLAAERQRAQQARGPADSWVDRSLMERCISRGVLGPLPGLYGNGLRIVQAPGYVALSHEMIHETRLIPLDGSPHVDARIRGYLGSARGRWDGDALVVETAHFNDKMAIARTSTTPDLRLEERFTRVSPDTIHWEIAVHDPGTWTAPWTLLVPMSTQPGYLVLPFDCHEGNHALRNILSGARAEERTIADAVRKGVPPPPRPTPEAEAGILPRDPSFGRPR